MANLLAEHPWLEDHLIVLGLRYIGRVRSVPAELTLGSLAAGEGFDPETTVARINVLLGGNTASKRKTTTQHTTRYDGGVAGGFLLPQLPVRWPPSLVVPHDSQGEGKRGLH